MDYKNAYTKIAAERLLFSVTKAEGFGLINFSLSLPLFKTIYIGMYLFYTDL